MNDLYTATYNPDVLSCLANLSNDEVFTPPEVANAMLDMLPQELFSDPTTTFLDPACKSGVFLREIVKRLLVGLEDQIPDQQERLDHILHKQVFGIAITEMTSLLSRRSVYCSKYANSDYSVSRFENIQGNIRYKQTQHTWKNGRCIWCGASEKEYRRSDGLETHAYEFIHTDKPEEIWNMEFTVICGNPPYQLSVGGGNGANAIPVYQKFIEQAQCIEPKYIAMITPSKWFNGGRGLDAFRNNMLNNHQIAEVHDFRNSKDCFTAVEIQGGVSYFLCDKDKKDTNCKFNEHIGSETTQTIRPLKNPYSNGVIRYNNAINIVSKVMSVTKKTFSSIVSSQTPFGLVSSFSDYHDTKTADDDIEYIKRKENGEGVVYVNKHCITKNQEWIDSHKIYISLNYGAGMSGNGPYQVTAKGFIGKPQSCCSQSYLVIAPFESVTIAENVLSYMNTKFFRFMVMLCVAGQTFSPNTYSLVPLQDFSKPWTDEELYAKYNLTQEEIDFIESMIKPME